MHVLNVIAAPSKSPIIVGDTKIENMYTTKNIKNRKVPKLKKGKYGIGGFSNFLSGGTDGGSVDMAGTADGGGAGAASGGGGGT